MRAPARRSSSHSLVLEAFRRSPGALWIERYRSLSPAAYRWMQTRAAKGLRFGVAARVENSRGQVLLVRLNRDSAWTRKWITPGGGAEPGETPREAILREIREETGVRVTNLRLWKVYHETLETEGDGGLSWDFLQFTAIWAGGRPHTRVPKEVTEARWFSRLPEDMEFREDWLGPPRTRFRPRRTGTSPP